MSKKRKKPRQMPHQPVPAEPNDNRFPYMSRPLGPLFARNEEELLRARPIRTRIMRAFLADAIADLAPGDKTSETYSGYLATLVYLRAKVWAEEWLELADAKDTADVLLIITPDLMSIPRGTLGTEKQCWDIEQQAIRDILSDPAMPRVRYVEPDKLN